MLGLSTNVLASLVPSAWPTRHAEWVLGATVVLLLVSAWLAVLAARVGDDDPDESGGGVAVGGHVSAEVAGAGAVVDRSVRGSVGSGHTVVAGPGAHVSIGSLRPEASLAQRPGQLIVGELPAAPPAFVGRAGVDELASVFAGGGRVAVVCALTGGRGVGKTQVAAQYARDAVSGGVKLVAWVSADGEDQLLTGLADVAGALGVADPDGDSRASAERLRGTLAARRDPAVLVFDNATDPALLRRYMPSTGATQIIITSTDRAFRSLGIDIDVGVFAREQSVAYLDARTGLRDSAGADTVADELGDLPLALAQAATVIGLERLSYDVYLERLRALPLEEMLPRDRGDSYPDSVARAILLSVDAVQQRDATGLTQRILSTTALLASDGIARTVLANILGLEGVNNGRKLDQALGALVAASVLGWAREGEAVVMHRLVARTIRDRLQSTDQLSDAMRATATRMRALLVSEDQPWERLTGSAEIVGHAMSVWQIALDAAARGALNDDPVEYVELAHWAVRHLGATADLSRAIQIGRPVLAECEQVLGSEHPETLRSRYILADAYRAAGDLGRAIPLYEATLTDRERVLGSEHPDTLGSRNNLAGAYQEAGDLGRAISLYEATLTEAERVLGSEHAHTLTSRNNLASAYRAAGDLGRAIPLYEATLTDRERVLGSEHPDTLGSRNNLAGAYEEAGDLGRAIPLYEATLTDCERVLGSEHPDTLGSRNNLAGAYEEAGDLGRAISLYEATLTDRERVLGSEHPHTLGSRNNLAYAYVAAGDLGRAISLYEATLTDRERVLGSKHPDTLTSRNNLAYAYQEAGDLGRASSLYEATLTDRERVLGSEHPDTLGSRNNLASAYRAAGDLGRAISLFEATLTDRERVLGSKHPDTLTSRNNLAGAYVAAGDLGRGISLYEATLSDCERVLGTKHPATATVRANLQIAKRERKTR
jgi:tetratricopeptide (TPR) repeat protein